MGTPQEILNFWINDVGEAGWYKADDAVDQEIIKRFQAVWQEARAGQLNHWACGPEHCLAYLVLTDQFSRNMFRGQPQAFETDALARRLAYRAVANDWDQKFSGPERQFFYVPMMHSEYLPDQERAVRWVMLRSGTQDDLLHVRAHREVIRTFSRFPYRNAALGRDVTAKEQDYLDAGGYAYTVQTLQAQQK